MTRMLIKATTIAGCLAAAATTGCAGDSTTTPPPANNTTMDLSTPPTPAPADPTPAPVAPPTPAPVTDATPVAGQRVHKVAAGDTIYKIAAQYYGHGSAENVKKILDANPGLDPRHLAVGKSVIVP